MELVDLEIHDANRAPEGWIAAVTKYSLLVRVVCQVVILVGHICTAQKIPTLCVLRVSFQTLCQILNSNVLILEGRSILEVQPAQLLEYLGIYKIICDHTFECILGLLVLLS